MAQRIDEDSARFRAIVRGKIKEQLKGYISQGELIGKKGKDLVSIPLPQITLPQFRYGHKQTGGVGQGPGDVGDSLGGGGSGKGEAGPGAGGGDARPRRRARAPKATSGPAASGRDRVMWAIAWAATALKRAKPAKARANTSSK